MSRQLKGLNGNKYAGLDDTQPAPMKPLADITASPVCKLLHGSRDKGEIVKDLGW